MGRIRTKSAWGPAVVLCLCALIPASAQESQLSSAPRRPSTLEVFSVRARYGLAWRNGGQADQGPGLSYQGLTPNDLSLSGAAWFIDYLGLSASFQREGFSLNDPAGLVTQGALIRAHGGLAGRLPIPPVGDVRPLRLELHAGYAFHQLPVFGSSVTPSFASVARHGLLLAARLAADLGPVTLEARGEVPIALAVSDPAGAAQGATGFAAGGGVRVNLFRTGKLWWGVLADGQYVSDTVTGADGFASTQQLVRFGLSVDVKWQDPPAEPPRFGGVSLRLVDADSGAPLPGAEVVVAVGGAEQKVVADAVGAARLGNLSPGSLAAKAALGGYLPAEAGGEVVAGVDLPLELRLKKEPPKVGALLVVVLEKEKSTPLADAEVTVGERSVKTDAEGKATLEGLPPGPVAIAVKKAGFNPGSEAASVVLGKTSEVPVALVPEKARVPATIKGIVRSTRGGRRIEASLEVPELKIFTRASADGTFTFRVVGGTYSVTISAPGYQSQTKSVTVKDGDQAIFNVDLYPK